MDQSNKAAEKPVDTDLTRLPNPSAGALPKVHRLSPSEIESLRQFKRDVIQAVLQMQSSSQTVVASQGAAHSGEELSTAPVSEEAR
jgi:hypothetical protein